MTRSEPDGGLPADRDLPAVWSEEYEVDIGPHVFPTSKYRLVRARLLEEGTLSTEEILAPRPATQEEILRVHTPEYLRKIDEGDFSLAEEWRLEVPFSPPLRNAMLLCAGGSILAARRALETGTAVHLGGGFHHAFPDHGEGFCLLNDIAVAAAALLAEGLVERVAVVDCDVHHGNGTAAIFADDDRVFTVSIHQEANYPAYKPPSDLDVGLDDGTGDEEYLALLRRRLPEVFERARPDIVLYLAGADPYREDTLGGLALSLEGLRARDDLVLRHSRDAGVPAAVALAGGYALRLDDTVEIHCGTVRAARAASAA